MGIADSIKPKRRNDGSFTTHGEVAAWYDAKYVAMSGGWHTPVEELDAHLDALGVRMGLSPVDHITLIDLGSGDGQLIVRALRRGVHCTGIDISAVGREMTARRIDAADDELPQGLTAALLGVPMERTGLPAASFDFAISLGSMEHCLDIRAAVHEMSRLLKAYGRWLLYVPNELWVHEDQPLETTAPSSWWVELLKGAGLVVVKDERMNDNNRITGYKSGQGIV